MNKKFKLGLLFVGLFLSASQFVCASEGDGLLEPSDDEFVLVARPDLHLDTGLADALELVGYLRQHMMNGQQE